MPRTTHGHYKGGKYSPTVQSWMGMIGRCTKTYNDSFKNYGARGISVDSRWLDFSNFLADMGERPEGYTLDRIDPAKGYFKANCQWACRCTQQHRRRDVKLSLEKVTEIKRLSTEGFSQKQIAEQFGVAQATISRVLNGKRWKPELPIINPNTKVEG